MHRRVRTARLASIIAVAVGVSIAVVTIARPHTRTAGSCNPDGVEPLGTSTHRVLCTFTRFEPSTFHS